MYRWREANIYMAPVAVSLVSHKALLNLINWWVALYSSIDGLPQVFHIGVSSDLTHYRWFDFIYMLDVDLIYVKAKIFCVGISSKQIWLQKSQWLRIYNWDYDFTRFVEAHRKVPHSVLGLGPTNFVQVSYEYLKICVSSNIQDTSEPWMFNFKKRPSR